ncbi:SpoIID/LytB domain-containing protein [Promicromonospora aerolata]|uniref:SpoIID/LytB domain-containing protein n=1 Tax=Promicromonospora aerolata TaxID=195749 RepID=A0ABW4VCZ4_9MICO
MDTRFALLAALLAATLVATPATAAPADLPDRFVITGSGYGHGVGMPQYGAYEMSRRGSTASGILRHYYRDTAVANRSTPALVDVQIYGPDPYSFSGYGDTTATTITVRDGAWRLRAGEQTVASGPAGKLRVWTSKGDIVVRSGDRVIKRDKLVLQLAGTRYFRPDGTRSTAVVDGAHGTYQHGRMVLSASKGIPNIVNRLRLNSEYLWGLAEMPASWGTTGGAQALRAQAVVGRSYALLKRADWKRTCRCHLVDDVRDQYFSGNQVASGFAGAHWVRAVNATKSSLMNGKVLVHGGRPVAAHYYSSSGGRTANSEDVWSSVIPYERSEADPYSKAAPGNGYARWTRGIGQAKAQRLFGLGQVASIRVADRYSSGQAKTLVATSPSGRTARISGSADTIRAKVGAATFAGNVPAAWFTSIRTR